jgi:DNA-binding CsgD family transcriptional regulator
MLTCPNAAADLMLRQLMAGLRERSPELKDETQVVPLISQPDSFAFACVGTVLNALHDGLAVIIVPQLDKAAATKRLSSLFALTGMDQRIVAQILEGHPPRRVGKMLNLTEATVRTYTKRLMFKLGIKRRSDLFRLAFLTAPPIVLNQFGDLGFNFRTGYAEKPLPQPSVRERIHASRRDVP